MYGPGLDLHHEEDIPTPEFGWKAGRYADGTYFIGIEPGDFICYHAPWDGHDYDT